MSNMGMSKQLNLNSIGLVPSKELVAILKYSNSFK